MRNSPYSKHTEILLLCLPIPLISYAALLAASTGSTVYCGLQELLRRFQSPGKPVLCSHSVPAVLLALLAYGFLILIWKSTERNRRSGEEHGSAKWGSVSTLNRALSQKNAFPLTRHVRLGMDTRKHLRNLNLLVIGGSGAGKTRSVVLPGILSAAAGESNVSLAITDPKGEILKSTGALLQRKGFQVKVFDLVNPEESNCYNPFRYLRSDQDVLKLITNLIRNTTPRRSTGDPFWEKSEIALLEALVFYLWYEAPEEEQNFGTVMSMLSYAEVREDDNKFVSPLDKLFLDLKEREPDHIAVRQFTIYKSAAGHAILE